MALKHVVLKVRCLWHGHEPTPGNRYSMVYDHYVYCIVCKHCLKVL